MCTGRSDEGGKARWEWEGRIRVWRQDKSGKARCVWEGMIREGRQDKGPLRTGVPTLLESLHGKSVPWDLESLNTKSYETHREYLDTWSNINLNCRASTLTLVWRDLQIKPTNWVSCEQIRMLKFYPPRQLLPLPIPPPTVMLLNKKYLHQFLSRKLSTNKSSLIQTWSP